ncbi:MULTISPECIES: hypothetical protein [unclassified Methanosarcina]|uniref:DUF7289 family protein n=1 Tax=unclassified Methanosarcina TaxID=2644672 RepID=UPI000B0997DC|nr:MULTISPECIES: hypothetical protein [unclassified Methanosarcina]
MSRKSLLKSESAAAIAIAAVLLLGLAFTIISVVKLSHVPEWKIDAERDYSYDAWSNMEDVKTRADIFTRFMSSDINYPYGLSATVPFSMGGGDVPVFEPSKSNGKLAVNTEECTMNITLAKHPDDPHTVDCGGVTYYSENRQYPDQVFRYENGALILAQGENSQMKRKPSFEIQKNETNDNYTVTINAINLTGEPESISSSTPTALRLTGYSIDTVLNSDVYTVADGPIDSFNLTICTHYTDAWATYLNNTAKKELEYGIDYTINSTDDYVCLSFFPTGNNYSIYVNKTVLCAELGAGGSLDIGEADDSESDEDEDESGSERIHGRRIILNKNEKGGVISSGTYIQFKNNGNSGNNNYYWIKIDDSETKLKKNDIVKLVIDGDQTSGTADMSANQITNFRFNVKMYINEKLEDEGKVTGIWVKDYSGYESTLTYKLPSYLSGTQLQVDGNTLISWWPYNDSAVNLYNIGPSPTNNNFLTMTFDTDETYFDCSGDYEIISN